MTRLMRASVLALAATAVAAAVAAAPSPRKGKAAKNEKIEGTMPDKAERLKQLTPMQLNVTQQCGTEPPFQNEYWNNHRDGIYVDVVSGEPLFLSKDKFDSGSGWPSFTRPIDAANVVTKVDDSHFMSRTEVRSKQGDSHLGHVFDDGPGPTHKRYCINSASLRFVPVADMAAQGYGQCLPCWAWPHPSRATRARRRRPRARSRPCRAGASGACRS